MPRDPYTGRSTSPAGGFDFDGVPEGRVATSKAAADAIRPVASTMRDRVYRYIADSGGYGRTDSEIQESLRMDPSTERPRRRELQKRGEVIDSGRRRLTRAGRQSIVWIDPSYRRV